MRAFLTTALILLLTLFPAGAVKKFDANPINVAVIIVEKGDSAKITSLFDYYGYEKKGIENGCLVMRTSTGHEMTYTFNDEGIRHEYPTIILKTDATQKEIDSTLKELKFKKVGNLYERSVSRYNNYITRCSVGTNNTLILQRIKTKMNK